MARNRLPQAQELLTTVWTLTSSRENVERLLAHIVQAQSEAIALAAAYGVKQSELAILADVSRQRIGQIVDQVDIDGLQPAAVGRRAHEIEEWLGDVMSALAVLARPADVDDVEYREQVRRKTAVVYGKAQADRRHDARSAFLSALPTSPEDRAAIAAHAEQARRRVSGGE